MRILVVDDDREIREFLKTSLQADAFVVDTAGDGEDGSYLGRVHDYDMILLDNVMPKKNGYQVCREIRTSGKSTPIIALSVQTEVDEKVNLLNAGVDDYLTKPFSYRELKSRMHALLRRPKSVAPTTLEVGDLTLDTMNQKVWRRAKEIYLTRKEFALAEYLMRNAGVVVSRGTLMEHVWDDDIDPFSNTIEVHIRNLRKKIDTSSRTKLIHTVTGRGYMMSLPDRFS